MATRPLYTALLWSGKSNGPFDILSSAVPAGFIWVVRHVSFLIGGLQDTLQNNVQLTDTELTVICSVEGYDCIGNTFHDFDLRQAVTTGDQLRLTCNAVNLTWRVTGYVLSLP